MYFVVFHLYITVHRCVIASSLPHNVRDYLSTKLTCSRVYIEPCNFGSYHFFFNCHTVSVTQYW